MIKKLVFDDFPKPLQNIQRNFSSVAPRSSILEYFLKNPDISTMVILDISAVIIHTHVQKLPAFSTSPH